jgi:hypothetical protein
MGENVNYQQENELLLQEINKKSAEIQKLE